LTTWEQSEAIFQGLDPKFKSWKQSQTEAYYKWQTLKRMLLFFPTGEGKTKVSLALMAYRGHKKVIVIAPPKTHASWKLDAAALGIEVRVESVEKFRMPGTKYPKDVPFIIDEFHKLGSHTGAGWKKFNRMMARLTVDVILASATPNYNDAERVFCLTAILEEKPVRDFLEWLVNTCEVKANPFSAIPDVVRFRQYDSALDFLVKQPYTAYVEDTASWTPEELVLEDFRDDVFEDYGYDSEIHKIMNSDMEKRHRRVNKQFINEVGLIRGAHMIDMWGLFAKHPEHKKWLIFCNHKTVAQALYKTAPDGLMWKIDGDTPTGTVTSVLMNFIGTERGFLIGTTALATGVDGIDKTCHAMLILDDIVGDDSLRRQLIGRILPRGGDDGIERLVVTATIK